MGVVVRERAVHESALMAARRGDYLDYGALQPEPQLPCGWEKCLDLKSGLIYFKDWNSGTLTYRDPRVQQRAIRNLAISQSGEARTHRLPWTDSETTTTSMQSTDDEQSLELSLNLPGSSSRAVSIPNQGDSVCTMEKVRTALERSNWLLQPVGKRSVNTDDDDGDDTVALSLLSSSNSSASSSSSSSQCSDSECFTSPSVMSYEGDDEEVLQQQPRRRRTRAGAVAPAPEEVMVTVGSCKSCLLYVMLSKTHPCCPKCGNTDVLLQLPAPAPAAKKPRVDSPTWSWSTA